MQAIQTRYLGATNTKPARMSAQAAAGRIVIAYEHGIDSDDNHLAAALALCAKMNWHGTLASGTLPNMDQCHVFTSRVDTYTPKA